MVLIFRERRGLGHGGNEVLGTPKKRENRWGGKNEISESGSNFPGNTGFKFEYVVVLRWLKRVSLVSSLRTV